MMKTNLMTTDHKASGLLLGCPKLTAKPSKTSHPRVEKVMAAMRPSTVMFAFMLLLQVQRDGFGSGCGGEWG